MILSIIIPVFNEKNTLTKLLNKIDKALRKIEEGTYGYCEETNQPISIATLKARPIATLSIEAQEMHEKAEKRIN